MLVFQWLHFSIFPIASDMPPGVPLHLYGNEAPPLITMK